MAQMISQTIKYDDGTEKVIEYQRSEDAAKIEAEVAEAQADTSDEVPEAPAVEVEEVKE